MKKFIFYGLLYWLTACSNQVAPEVKQSTNYNPETEARIRLFGQNNYSTTVSNTNIKKQVGGVRAESFGGLISEIFTPLKSVSIGIPKTNLIEKLTQSRSNMLAGLYYEEYVIPANQTYEIKTSFRDGGTGPVHVTCDVEGKVYIQNNTDYEVFADIISNKCVIQVYKIVQDGNSVKQEIVPIIKNPSL